jgi:hypothetical protein
MPSSENQPLFKQVRQLIRQNPHAVNKQVNTWFGGKIEELIGTATPDKTIKDNKTLQASDVFIGKMAFYFYDPKWKKELKYYDKFPLLIPFDVYKDGFIGYNLHYLPVEYRVALLSKLLEFANNERYDVTTKLKLSYQFLKSASKYKELEPCIHKYLANHVRSKFVIVQAYDWATACLLPVERFEKASKQKVWEDSRKKMNKPVIDILKKRKKKNV